MKVEIMKKSVLIVLFTISLGLVSAMAQQGRGRHADGRMKTEKPEMRSEERRLTAIERADRMAKELDLTDQEKSEVAALFQKQDDAREKRMEERRNQAAAQKDDREAMRKANDAELEKIIGKEKFEQYEKIRVAYRNEGRAPKPNIK